MADFSAADITVIAVVVTLRLGVPLLIPRYPLPAILAALVIDGIDQTIFQSFLSPHGWASFADSYQGYDKALDVYYLSIAYISTMRSWTNYSAVRWAQFLWLYRLTGTAIFETLHNTDSQGSWRWLLLVFPNTFEYFFIAYEAIRLRWDPRPLTPHLVTGLVAFIWIVIKLPQEWWIHVAQLDFTNEAAAHTWIWPTLVIGLVVLVGGGSWAVRYRLPPADRRASLRADPMPADLDTAVERADYRALHWRLFDSNLLEKVVLVTLVCEIFAEILPGSTATPAQVGSAVAVLVVINAATGLILSRRRFAIENTAVAFAFQFAINSVIVIVLRLFSSRFALDDAVFFVLLISLIVLLYDRYRPVRNERFRVAGDAELLTHRR